MAGRLSAVPPLPEDYDVGESIFAAARSGNRVELLEAMRDAIARELDDGVGARELASLTKRLGDLALEIQKLQAVEGGVVADESRDHEDTSFDPEAI